MRLANLVYLTRRTWITAMRLRGSGPANAITRFVRGLSHDDSHLAQIADIVRQAKGGQIRWCSRIWVSGVFNGLSLVSLWV